MTKIAVGLSGGVDSTVTALILKKQGFEVIGLTMDIDFEGNASSCLGGDKSQNIQQIKKWCQENQIPHFLIDCTDVYKSQVLEYLKYTYLQGMTPNPCIQCNAFVKFNAFLKKAREKGINFDFFATGHYVQLGEYQGNLTLKRGVDETKDQSYFLYRLDKELLPILKFPLGGMTKKQVRELAHQEGLSVADKKDSQDLCVGDYHSLLKMPISSGNALNQLGEKLGIHKGYIHYTIGQRKGIGIASSEPLFVTAIHPETNQIILGPEKELFRTKVYLKNPHFFVADLPVKVLVKYRSTVKPVSACLFQENGLFCISFDEPQKALTQGQSLVCYDKEFLLGGGIIDFPSKSL